MTGFRSAISLHPNSVLSLSILLEKQSSKYELKANVEKESGFELKRRIHLFRGFSRKNLNRVTFELIQNRSNYFLCFLVYSGCYTIQLLQTLIVHASLLIWCRVTQQKRRMVEEKDFIHEKNKKGKSASVINVFCFFELI